MANTLPLLPAGDFHHLAPDPATPETFLLEALRAIPAPAPEGVGPRNVPVVAQLQTLLSAGAMLTAAISDNAIEAAEPLPAAVVATLGASLQAMARDLEMAERFARSEALPALTHGHRLPTPLDRHDWTPSTHLS
jgi:hypothetical protein